MPTYEYQCDKCKKGFEVFQSMKDDAFTTCPKEQCRQKTWGKSKVKRLLGTGAGLIFKGSGFYITDYRSDAYQQAAKSDAPAGGGGDAKSDGAKTDAPAAADGKPAAGDAKGKTSAEAKPAAPAKSESTAKTSSPKAS